MTTTELVTCYSCGQATPLWRANGDDVQCYDEWDRLIFECPDCHEAHRAVR
jgi:hypothetical protein